MVIDWLNKQFPANSDTQKCHTTQTPSGNEIFEVDAMAAHHDSTDQ